MAGKYESIEDARVSDSGSKLAELLGAQLRDIVRQKAEQGQLSQRAQLEQQQRQADIATAEELQKTNPDMPVRVGDVSLGGRDPLRDLLRSQQMSEKNVDNQRLETKAIQDEFNRIEGGTRGKVKALNEINTLLKNPGQASWGQISTALSRASGEKGALAEGDVQRALPKTLRSTAASIVNFVRPGTMNPYAESQKQEIANIVDEKRKLYEGDLMKGEQEISQRASTLAPSLTQSGQIRPVLESLGIGAKSTPNAVPSAQSKLDVIMKRIQELEAKKARGGR